jgi:hypothetical protein
MYSPVKPELIAWAYVGVLAGDRYCRWCECGRERGGTGEYRRDPL